jgi:hypothetical protein
MKIKVAVFWVVLPPASGTGSFDTLVSCHFSTLCHNPGHDLKKRKYFHLVYVKSVKLQMIRNV